MVISSGASISSIRLFSLPASSSSGRTASARPNRRMARSSCARSAERHPRTTAPGALSPPMASTAMMICFTCSSSLRHKTPVSIVTAFMGVVKLSDVDGEAPRERWTGEQAPPPLPPPVGIGNSRGCDPLALSRGVFWRRCWFPTGLGVFFGADCAGAENIRMKFFSDSKNRRAGLKV